MYWQQSHKLNKYTDRSGLQTSYAIQTDPENSWQDIWDHTWACWDTDKQADRQTHFSTNSLTRHSFHGNHHLVSPKQCWVPEENQTNSDLLWSSKPSKTNQSSLSHKAAWTLLNLPTCQLKLVTNPKIDCSEMGPKTLGTAFLYHLLVFMVVCVWLNAPLTLRMETKKCRAHKSYWRDHKTVMENNVLSSFSLTPVILEIRVLKVWILRGCCSQNPYT